MTFGKAIDLMKLDSSIKFRRVGWNGKNMYIFYVRAETVVVTKEHPFGRIFIEGTVINTQSYLAMKTSDNTVIPWLASQSDMLAEDWEIFQKTQ